MADPRAELSVVNDSGSGLRSSCGYCGGTDTSVSHGMPTRKLTVYAYQDLIDQGWRRSGCYLYKPDLANSCCKAYTIRLDVQEFTPDKGQRRLIRKWRSYLEGKTSNLSEEEDAGGRGDAAAGTGTAPVSACDLPTAHALADGNTGVAGAQSGPGRQRSAADCSPPSWPPAHCDVPTAVMQEKEANSSTLTEERALQQILAAALQAAMAAGDLPTAAGDAPYPAPAVHRCTDKQRQSLPADVRFTSSSAFPLAAAIARRGSSAAAVVTMAGRPQHGGSGDGGGDAAHLPGQPQMSRLPKQLRKSMQLPDDVLSVQEVAAVLTRHFNALVASGTAAADGGTADGTVAEKAAQVASLRGPRLHRSLAAWDWHGGGRPEAYTANGHLNIRMRLPHAGTDNNGPAGAAVPGVREVAAAVDGVNAARGRGRTAASHTCIGSPVLGDDRAHDGAKPSNSPGSSPSPSSRTNAVPRSKPRAAGPPLPPTTAQTKSRHTTTSAGTPATRSSDSDSLAMPSGRLQIRMVPSQFLREEFELYTRYQMGQHGDEPWQLTRVSYTRFLVDSPLSHVGRDRDPSAPECGYGSFHQQYWLDGKLIAVGVVDVLPRCLSSVYFFWDISLASLALGRFSALQEILWVQRQIPTSPDLHYYYMGFYIHTCPKMRYKAEYRPSDLLCPVRKVWVRITPQLLAAIERSPYVVLSAQDSALCQANLAARPASTANKPGGKEDCNRMDEAAANETLVLLPEEGVVAGPVPLKVLRRYNLFSQRGLQMIENAIREWRCAVGWTAPFLVYQL